MKLELVSLTKQEVKKKNKMNKNKLKMNLKKKKKNPRALHFNPGLTTLWHKSRFYCDHEKPPIIQARSFSLPPEKLSLSTSIVLEKVRGK